jgi:hypothetical protein
MNVIDLEQARERLAAAQFLGLVTEATGTVLPDIGAIEGLLRSGRALSEKEVHGLAGYLGRVLHTGLFGRHARTWAASLLAKLGEVAGPAISPDDGVLVEEARAAMAGFDAVAFGTISPEAMRAFVLEGELALPHPPPS